MANRIILNNTSYHGKGAIKEIPNIAKAKGFTKEDRKLRARLVTVENAIAEKEEKLKIIEESLANPGNNADIFALTAEYQELRQATDSLTEEWTALMEQLDN